MAKGSYAASRWPPTTSTPCSRSCEASGAEVVQEPTDQPYGVRDCAFRDPAGNLMRINEVRLTVRPRATREAQGDDEPTQAATTDADNHDPIRVLGARVNNLKDISVEIPKRRLTVFTGVSGSGKSSLVFGTIAAESQRLINETYSAFVQGFMPTLARPDVDLLEGLTTAIIVDQERMGTNPRSTVGTVTDANAMLRILFSRLGTPYVGPQTAFSFNVPTRRASGVMSTDKGGRVEKSVVKTPSTSAACARGARAWATSATST